MAYFSIRTERRVELSHPRLSKRSAYEEQYGSRKFATARRATCLAVLTDSQIFWGLIAPM